MSYLLEDAPSVNREKSTWYMSDDMNELVRLFIEHWSVRCIMHLNIFVCLINNYDLVEFGFKNILFKFDAQTSFSIVFFLLSLILLALFW